MPFAMPVRCGRASRRAGWRHFDGVLTLARTLESG